LHYLYWLTVSRAALREYLTRLWAEHGQAADGITHIKGEYPEVVATRT
jgi:hypothetical protein